MKTKFLILFLFVITSLYVSAQATEGTVTYAGTLDDIKMPNIDASTAAQMKAMMKNISLAISFKDKDFRADMDMGMAKASTIKVNGKTTVLSEAMGQKYKFDQDQLEKAKGKEEDYEITYTDSTKTIAGYECKKAVVKKKDGTTTVIFYTDKLPATYSMYTGFSKFKGGCPMQFTMSKSGMVMTMVATNVSLNPVSKDIFVIPDGYQELTADQLKQMMGGSK
jgi:GLPGLI family protein